MEVKRCPKCAVDNPADAFLCPCGFEFAGDEELTTVPNSPPVLSQVTLTRRMIWLAAFVITGSAGAIISHLLRGNPILWPGDVKLVEAIATWATFIGLLLILFVAVLFSGRVLVHQEIGWIMKTVTLCLIAAGAFALAAGLLFAGCVALSLTSP